MDDIDDVMRDVQERESRDSGAEQVDRTIGNLDYDGQQSVSEAELETADTQQSARRINVGRVEHFFSKINVVALHLTGTLRVGDTIEIDTEDGPVRARVSEMQIDRKDVEVATYGDDVGIKVDRQVSEGSDVFLVG
ncbi:MAG TPA: hypothetical protein VMV00_02340 [Candidatus Baltobacteraceae bacterium]|nr:hypothetical protein [Candidatus Baltobacteraceae bacterium]